MQHKIVIITDHNIKKIYGTALQKKLEALGYCVLLIAFAAGEKSKNYKTKQFIENKMQQHQCDKDTVILAFGGGVVGDMAGFVAATYLRGIPYIQMPTSLLAMVDSSIGGKTGINTAFGKNMIGCIYQPQQVLIEPVLLSTLPKVHLINGLIEAFKMFLTHDIDSFSFARTNLPAILQGNTEFLAELINRAINIKSMVVSKDPNDYAERNTLNFGHTIGHALEKISNYEILHGYAVAYGILVEATISYLAGLLDINQLAIIKNLMNYLNIHGQDLRKYDATALLETTKVDKKNRHGKVNYVLIQDIGQTYTAEHRFAHPIEDSIVKQALASVSEG